jgi:hypothetical protein
VRIKITIKGGGYSGSEQNFVLPDSGSDVVLLLAQAQFVEPKFVTFDGEKFYVTDQTKGLDVQVIDDDAIISHREFLMKQAAHADAQAKKKVEEAEKAKRKVDEVAPHLTANQVAALIDVYRYGYPKDTTIGTFNDDMAQLRAHEYLNGVDEITELGTRRIKMILGEK